MIRRGRRAGVAPRVGAVLVFAAATRLAVATRPGALLVFATALSLIAPAAGLASGGAGTGSASPVADVASASTVAPVAGNFEFRELADGVWAALRNDPPGLMCDANSVVIVTDEGVVVVDAPVSTPAVIDAIRAVTDQPVHTVINTHWHDDHITGNAAYRAAWPEVEFIGHARMRDYLPGTGAKNRAAMIQGAPGGVASLRQCLTTGVSLTGDSLTAEERTSFESDIALVEQYLAVVPGAEVLLPTIAVEERLVLQRGGRTIEIFHPGAGHTAADLAVYLPKEKILVTGDLVIHPVPLVGQDQSHVTTWSGALERLAALDARLIVPGHGPVLTGREHLDLMARTFTAMATGVRQAMRPGRSLDEVRAEVPLDDFRTAFAGPSALRRLLFDFYVAGPGIGAAYRELQPAAEDSLSPR